MTSKIEASTLVEGETLAKHTPWSARGDADDWRRPEHETASVSSSAPFFDATGAVVGFAVATGWNEKDDQRRHIILRAVNAYEANEALIKEMVEAASGVLKHRHGNIPARGWLHDTDESREALQALADLVAKAVAT